MKIYDIKPIGMSRMSRADKWKQRPAVMRYRAFCDEARLSKIHLPEAGAHVTFVMPMQQSWIRQEKAQHAGCPHQSKPDCDKMLKALIDALYDYDSHVWDYPITKSGVRKDSSLLRRASEI